MRVEAARCLNRGGLAIEVDLSLPAARIIRVLNPLIEWRGKPKVIRCDSAPEYISGALMNCTSTLSSALLPALGR